VLLSIKEIIGSFSFHENGCGLHWILLPLQGEGWDGDGFQNVTEN
jgi:hypothetical protein